MTNTYLVVYDVNTEQVPLGVRTADEVYQSLYDAIKSYGTWAHLTYSCWVIVSDRTAVEIRDSLRSVMRTSDRLAVVQTAHIAAWSNVLCNNEWLQSNL